MAGPSHNVPHYAINAIKKSLESASNNPLFTKKPINFKLSKPLMPVVRFTCVLETLVLFHLVIRPTCVSKNCEHRTARWPTLCVCVCVCVRACVRATRFSWSTMTRTVEHSAFSTLCRLPLLCVSSQTTAKQETSELSAAKLANIPSAHGNCNRRSGRCLVVSDCELVGLDKINKCSNH